MYRIMAASVLLAMSMAAIPHEYMNLDDLMKSFGSDLESAEITTETVAPGIHVLYGAGGNVVVSIGDQGVMMVDSQFPQMIPRISAAIAELGGGDIDFTINTHWHFDHADGNPLLGRDGSWIVAQANSRRMMVGKHTIDLVNVRYEQPAYPPEGLPVITFTDHMQFHFNDQPVDLLHFGPAHTTGDTAVIFRESNVVHMGDVFNAAGYPFIDAGNGGDLDGLIRFCRKVLARLDADSIIVPGHGAVKGYDDMESYIVMLETARDRISDMIDSGMSLDEVIAAAPTAEFDAQYGNPARFVDRAYVSLSR